MVSVNDKHVYKNYMQYMFECHGNSIESTIVWMSKHYGETPQIFKAAKRELTVEQRNEIIREIIDKLEDNNMRILKGYSEEERKELEEAKNNHFGSAIDLIRGIVMGNNDCMYLAGKYAAEKPGKDNQLARDIADYYADVAKFAEPQKYYVHLIRNNDGSYLNRNMVSNCCITNSYQPDEIFQTEFTEQEIRAIDPRYMSFMEDVEDDKVEEENE